MWGAPSLCAVVLARFERKEEMVFSINIPQMIAGAIRTGNLAVLDFVLDDLKLAFSSQLIWRLSTHLDGSFNLSCLLC
jgi:hypothetical protein